MKSTILYQGKAGPIPDGKAQSRQKRAAQQQSSASLGSDRDHHRRKGKPDQFPTGKRKARQKRAAQQQRSASLGKRRPDQFPTGKRKADRSEQRSSRSVPQWVATETSSGARTRWTNSPQGSKTEASSAATDKLVQVGSAKCAHYSLCNLLVPGWQG